MMFDLCEIQTGSYLYGTNTPTSDRDYVGIFIPDPARILLCEKIDTISKSSGNKDSSNTSSDIDMTRHPLHKFLQMVARGDTVAMDVLFAPESAYIKKSESWGIILQQREKLLSSNCDAYLGYMRRQTSRYGVKADRVISLENAISFMEQYLENDWHFLSAVKEEWVSLFSNEKIKDITQYFGYDDEHIHIVGRKWPWGAKIRLCLDQLLQIREKYGDRTQKAVEMNGTDWKAMHHALRAGQQMIELLNDHHITFPRPNAGFLIKVKTGQVPREQVEEEIEQLTLDIEEAREKTTLPSEVDKKIIRDIVFSTYGGISYGFYQQWLATLTGKRDESR